MDVGHALLTIRSHTFRPLTLGHFLHTGAPFTDEVKEESSACTAAISTNAQRVYNSHTHTLQMHFAMNTASLVRNLIFQGLI